MARDARRREFENFDAGDAIGLILVVLEDAFDTSRLFSQGGLRSKGAIQVVLIFLQKWCRFSLPSS